ncbi:MAG: hypothetical protein IT452_20275 [Planctomycetia bacterium]|nr:hypothetical protein [Planctomycetia bacterium]
MKLRRLNEAGVRQFTEYLDALRSESTLAPPVGLLEDQSATERVVPNIEVEPCTFASRFDAAAYLNRSLDAKVLPGAELDLGLWCWLTLFYFDQVCPARGDGSRKRLEVWRYLPAIGNFRKYYRHFLLGPFLIYRAHGGDESLVGAILANRVNITDDLMEQLAGYQNWITNRSVLEVQTSLYYDAALKKLKEGARSKGAGSPRRLSAVLEQFDLTFDISGIATDRLIGLLPAEFDRFRSR